MLGLAGLLARGVLGGALLEEGANPNQALPMLFIELFPTWLAALIGVGILAAIMSTADGLVVSSSQIIANDIYRRSLASVLAPNASEAERDRQELLISRVATVAVLVICTALAWLFMERNIALTVWIGIGGMLGPPFSDAVTARCPRIRQRPWRRDGRANVLNRSSCRHWQSPRRGA